MTRKVHAVGVIFEDERGRVLVLRRNPDSPEGTTWGLAGGKIEPGEDRGTAAVREVQEEIGHNIDPSKLQFIKTYHWDRADLDITFEVFLLPSRAHEVTLEVDQTEHSEYLWALPKELHARSDLMRGLYPILEDVYHI